MKIPILAVIAFLLSFSAGLVYSLKETTSELAVIKANTPEVCRSDTPFRPPDSADRI